MKAVVCHGEKDLRIEELASPSAILPDQVRIAVGAGGICGSDLHYYNHGGFGAIRVKEPMTLGHEVAGRIAEVGSEVTGLKVGDLVAINPSRPCYECQYCRKAQYNQCLDMRYYGSAMRFPHVQGAFSEELIAEASQCCVLAGDVTAAEGACAEPLSVGLHAVNRAGSLLGKRVLVTGTGPIGALAVAAAKLQGALEVVATDVVDEALEVALKMGADRTINVATNAEALQALSADKGYFDIVIEASGNPMAIKSAAEVIKPRGRLVQLGLGGEASIPAQLVAKEIEICGSFRFHEEFEWACELISSRRINLDPLVSGVYPFEDAVAAFESAGDRKHSMKVILTFNA